MIRKGTARHVAIEALRSAGRTEVVARALEPGDVPEDMPPTAGDAVVSPLLGRSRAATGRVNLWPRHPGLLRVDAAQIDRLNTIDESITIGTLPDYAVVAERTWSATIKVIPFAVPGKVFRLPRRWCGQARCALTLARSGRLKVGLVITALPGLKDSVTDKTIAITEARVTRLTGRCFRRCTARMTRSRSAGRWRA